MRNGYLIFPNNYKFGERYKNVLKQRSNIKVKVKLIVIKR